MTAEVAAIVVVLNEFMVVIKWIVYILVVCPLKFGCLWSELAIHQVALI